MDLSSKPSAPRDDWLSPVIVRLLKVQGKIYSKLMTNKIAKILRSCVKIQVVTSFCITSLGTMRGITLLLITLWRRAPEST